MSLIELILWLALLAGCTAGAMIASRHVIRPAPRSKPERARAGLPDPAALDRYTEHLNRIRNHHNKNSNL